jgi:hypothetical protein
MSSEVLVIEIVVRERRSHEIGRPLERAAVLAVIPGHAHKTYLDIQDSSERPALAELSGQQTNPISGVELVITHVFSFRTLMKQSTARS